MFALARRRRVCIEALGDGRRTQPEQRMEHFPAATGR
jgi:hypothetical protein